MKRTEYILVNMNKHILLCLFLFIGIQLPLFAQQNQPFGNNAFDNFREGLQTEFDNFRKEINAEYAEFLSEAWKEYRLLSEKHPDKTPKPLQPASSLDEKNEQAIRIMADEIIDKVTNRETAEKPQERLDTFSGTSTFFDFEYFGAKLQMRYQKKSFHLSSIKEEAVAKLWQEISSSKFIFVLADMLRCKEVLHMNDWAYFLLAEKVVEHLSTLPNQDCKTIYQHFLLVQSGYDVRLARIDQFLVLLLPIREEVYSRHYIEMDNKQYYAISHKDLNMHKSIFTYQLPENLIEKPHFSLAITRELLLPAKPKDFCISAAGLEVKGEVNLNLIRFYENYLSCELKVYAHALPEQKLSKQVITSLNTQLSKKPFPEALNQLLAWVQNGFQYKTDSEQFGYEKPFFFEENFYYPACDCEDRSILFAYLVRQLWNKETLLLDYPGHVATAIHSNEQNIKGTYIQLQGKKYLLCDPTYINAKAGQVMPSCKSKRPKVIKL